MRRVVILLLVLALAGGGVWWWRSIHPSQNVATEAASGPPGRLGPARRSGAAAEAIPVTVARAESRDVPIWLDGLGTVQASATVTIKPMVDGPLVEVRFKEGQDVKAGDVLARIDPRTYQATLDSAVAKKKQDEATLANDRLDMARYDKLAATAYASAQQASAARALVAELEAQVQADQASIDSARTQLSYTTITAPVDGRMGFRQVDQGNIVHASDTTGLAVLTTLRPITVQFTLPQQALPQVAAAMAGGTPEVVALPQEAGAAASRTASTGAAAVAERPVLDRGQVSVLDNQVDSTTGTIRLRASFPNEKLTLWPGAFVSVRLRVATLKAATTVPPVAVQRGPQGPYVYVIGDDQTATRKPVTLSHEDQSASVVAQGLAPGERVVIDGASRLTDGAKAVVTEPQAAPVAPAAGQSHSARPDSSTSPQSAPASSAPSSSAGRRGGNAG